MTLLRIRNLCVDFATASGKFRAVDGVDQDVNESEILAIVGESGSGKSVSMLALMGLLGMMRPRQAATQASYARAALESPPKLLALGRAAWSGRGS